MANSPEYHAKLIVGDLLLKLATLSAENEALKEQVKNCKACQAKLKAK